MLPEWVAAGFLFSIDQTENIQRLSINDNYLSQWSSINVAFTLTSLWWSILTAVNSAFWFSKCVLLRSSPTNRNLRGDIKILFIPLKFQHFWCRVELHCFRSKPSRPNLFQFIPFYSILFYPIPSYPIPTYPLLSFPFTSSRSISYPIFSHWILCYLFYGILLCLILYYPILT